MNRVESEVIAVEELLKQVGEFDQSFWGGLFYFLVGIAFVASYCLFWPVQNWKLWLAVSGLIISVGWTIYLFRKGHALFGSLLAFIVLAGITRTIAVEIQKRRQKTRYWGG